MAVAGRCAGAQRTAVSVMSPPAEPDREHPVLGIERRPVVVPFRRRQKPLASRSATSNQKAGCVSETRPSTGLVPIRVSRLPDVLRRRHVDLVAGIVHGRPVSVHVNRVAADDRRRLHLERQAAHPPQLARWPRRPTSTGTSPGRRSDHVRQRLARRSASSGRSGLGPLGPPFHPSAPLVDGHDERPDALVAHQDDEVADDDRGAPMP